MESCNNRKIRHHLKLSGNTVYNSAVQCSAVQIGTGGSAALCSGSIFFHQQQ